MVLSSFIPRAFWSDRLDVSGEMVKIEEENVGIAGVTSRLSDEESGHFPQQIPVKFKRFGYSYNHNQ